MLTFKTNTPSSCGIVEIDNEQVVHAFHEKLVDPPGDRANGALYAFEKDFRSPQSDDSNTQRLQY